MGNDIIKKSKDTYTTTSEVLEELKTTFPYYQEVLRAFKDGNSTAELKKRHLLKAIDEVWVKAIEDTLPSLDVIIRNPGQMLQEEEEIVPVELAKKVTSKAVIYLSRHTNDINQINDDGTVMPSKLLNVYQDDTYLTYENKFINTLLNRLYAFVIIRYDAAEKCGVDEVNTVLNLNQEFEHNDVHGKISLSIEVAQPTEEGTTVEKNYIYDSDIWKRVEKIVKVLNTYMSSPFIQRLGKNYVKPPIIRTNKLLKNVDFRQCLTLYEFLSTYENTGYTTTVQESLENIDEKCLYDMYTSMTEQYVIFKKYIDNEQDFEAALDQREFTIDPKIKDELDPVAKDELDYEHKVKEHEETEEEAKAYDANIELALKVALAADKIFEPKVLPVEDEPIKYRYRYSFTSRLILAQNPTQDYYTEIKNELLSYKGVKANMSWSRESFKRGLKKCAYMNMRGKTLCLYLPLNPDDYIDSKYKFFDVTNIKKYEDTPFMMKIKNPRNVKYAIELIRLVMEQFGLVKDPSYVEKDFHLKLQTIEQMLRRRPPLVKLLYGNMPVDEDDENEINYIYEYSFLGRLILAERPAQDYYTEIKNKLMSYRGVKDSMSWSRESFKKGLRRVAYMNMRGKTLCLYLPLNPKEYEDNKYHFTDVSETKKYSDAPFMVKIKNPRNVKVAKELIEIVMTKLGLALIDNYEAIDYHYPHATIEELLWRKPPLVRLLNGRLEDIPRPQPVVTPVVEETSAVEDNSINYMYNYSFMGRLILAKTPAQDFYTALKNELMSYEGVKSNVSWKHEAFHKGMNKVAFLDMKGKTLCIYLPLDPKEYAETKYKVIDVSTKRKYEDIPLLYKIKNPRNCKYAIELIEVAMEKLGLVKNESFVAEDYHYPEATIDQLLRRNPPLVKLIKGEMPPIDEAVEEETIEEEVTPVVEEVVNEELPIMDENGNKINYMYNYSFMARLILAENPAQDFYSELKNYILSYQGTKSNVSWSHELFKKSLTKIAYFAIKGKTLNVYLACKEEDFVDIRIKAKDCSASKKYADTPYCFKIKSNLAVKYLKQIIDRMMEGLGLLHDDDYVSEDYHVGTSTVSKLLARKLIKLASGEQYIASEEDLEEEVIEESEVEVTPIAVEPVVEEVEEIETEEDNDNELPVIDENGNKINYMYNYSYTARLILAELPTQDFYNEIKNFILSYKNVKSNVSWSHELFKRGLKKVAFFTVRGKTLNVYLPVKEEDLELTRLKAKDCSASKKYGDTPYCFKVKSNLAAKYIKVLIAKVMEDLGLTQDDNYKLEDYRPGKSTIEKLLFTNPPLIKPAVGVQIIKPEDFDEEEVLIESYTTEVEEVEKITEEVVETSVEEPIEEEIKQEEAIEDSATEEIDEEESTKEVEEVIEKVEDSPTETKKVIETPVEEISEVEPVEEVGEVQKEVEEEYNPDDYRISFMARLFMTSDEIKDMYSQIKNKLLSYQKVKYNITWTTEEYRIGTKVFGKIVMNENSITFVFEESQVEKVVTNLNELSSLLNDIDALMNEINAISKGLIIATQYKFETKSFKELIRLGYIKKI